MQEILAENLQPLFDNTSFVGVKTYSGDIYEIWQVSDDTYESMCNMTDEEFEKICPESMWRSDTGSILGYPTDYLIVNKKKLRCWDRKEKPYRHQKYQSLLEYLCENVGASTPKNVCACAVDLANCNNMTMGELFAKYEG